MWIPDAVAHGPYLIFIIGRMDNGTESVYKSIYLYKKVPEMAAALFALYEDKDLRALPKWLALRTYNVAITEMEDRKGDPCISLRHVTKEGFIDAGIICVYDDIYYGRAVEIVKLCCKLPDFQRIMRGAANHRSGIEFIQILKSYETLMPSEQAFKVTCQVLGVNENEANAMLAKVA